MITTPTTLVLGAGASKPYGLPTGAEMLDKARRLEPGSLDGVFNPLIETLAIPSAELADVVAELRQHKAPTLDAVLEHRPDLDRYLRPMVAGLLSVERTQMQGLTGPPEDHDWLQHLCERLCDGSGSDWRQFRHNNRGLRVVTFNLDDIVETAIANTVGRVYKDCDADQAAHVAREFGVIHVHGTLAPSADLEPEWLSAAGEVLDFGPEPRCETGRERLAAARAAVQEAEVVCFLGFGYHRSNLERLQATSGVANNAANTVFGSAFGVPDGTRDWIEAKVPGIKLGASDVTSADILDRFFVFRD